MEQNTYEFIPKIPDIFCCKACDYITSIKKDYNMQDLPAFPKILTKNPR